MIVRQQASASALLLSHMLPIWYGPPLNICRNCILSRSLLHWFLQFHVWIYFRLQWFLSKRLQLFGSLIICSTLIDYGKIPPPTYIHNSSLQPYRQDYWPSFSYHLRVNFINMRRNLQFKVDSELQILEQLFMTILFIVRVFARNLLIGSRRRNTFCILSLCLAWCSNTGFKPKSPPPTVHFNL